MKERYVIEFPHKIVVARAGMKELPGLIEEFGFRDPLFVVGEYTQRFVEGRKLFVNAADKAFLDSVSVEADLIVGVGGGKNLDAAKYLSMRTGIPFALVPTLPSSDGIVSPSISLIEGRKRLSLFYRPPLFVLIDFDVVASAPRQYILSGYGDMVAKYSSLYDWWLGHKRTGEYFGVLTYKLVRFALQHVLHARHELFEPEGIHVLLESLILSGGAMGIQGSSRPASGSEHLISHALDLIHLERGEPLRLHGLQVGLATIFTTYLQGRRWTFVKRVLEDVGHPTRLEALNIDEDTFVEAVLMAPSLRNRYTILNEYNLSRPMVKRIIEEVGLA